MRAPRTAQGRWDPPWSRVAILLLIPLVGCTFERRPNGGDEVAVEEPTDVLSPSEAALDSVRAVHRVFTDAMEEGDLSQALSFIASDAVVLDRLGDLDPQDSSRGEILLEVLRRRGEGLALEPLETDVTLHGEAALVVTRYRVVDEMEEGEEVLGVQTLVLVRGETGWMIQHLHHSLGASTVP